MLKKRIIKGIVLTIISLIAYLTISSYCEAKTTNYLSTYHPALFTDTYRGGTDLQYVNYVKYENQDTDYMFFCNRLGYPPILANRMEGNASASYGTPDISTVKTEDKKDEINPQIAYALSIGVLPKNLGGDNKAWTYMQNIVWDAKMDEGENDGVLDPESWYNPDLPAITPIEVQRFIKVYEQIFEKTIGQNKPLFKLKNKQASLFVDQNDGTYIYGPFELSVNCKVSQEVIDYLVKEIKQQGREEYIDYDDNDFEKSEAYIENFYKFHEILDKNFIDNGISDESKKKLQYSIASENQDKNFYSTIIVDKTGKPIEFPQMTSEESDNNNFFIKFYPAKEGAIINLGNMNDDTELFHLKVKYGSYVNYKEHIQTAAFYTKGVMGYIQTTDLVANRVIDPNAVLKTFDDKKVRVVWRRIDGMGPTVQWFSSLKSIYAPKTLILYDNDNGEFIENAKFQRNWSDTQSYYYLDNYYPSIRCTGFSQNGKMQTGAQVNIPFIFAGTTQINLDDATRTLKDNFAFPLKSDMELVKFYGIVKEEATATFRASHEEWEEGDEITGPDPDNPGQTIVTGREPGEWVSASDWTTTKKVYRYRYKDITASDIINLYSNIINTGSSPRTPEEGSIIDDDAYPSAPSDDGDDRYGSVTRDSLSDSDWSIVQIYGNNTNSATGDYGFKYTTKDEGWFYDTDFTTYDTRRVLAEALGTTHEAKEYAGRSVDEYDVWIPRDMEDFARNINSYSDYQAYQDIDAEIQKIRDNMQSFISFEGTGEGDVFKYGTRIAIERVALPHLKIAEAFGGNVWKDSVDVKGIAEKSINGIYDPNSEEAYQGVKVDLYECKINYKEPQRNLFITEDDVDKGEYLTSTFTDEKGDYRFYGKIADNTPLINPLRKYYVKFVYNGQIYAQTLYNVEIDSLYNSDTNESYGKYKDYTSKGVDEYRTEFNKRFENIYADSNNYTYAGQRYAGCNGTLTQSFSYTGRAYGLKHVVKEALDGVTNDPSADPSMDTFEEQYNFFTKNNTHSSLAIANKDYEFAHAPGNNLETPIETKGGEITTSDIDKNWEHTVKQPIDYNYAGLSPSVANFIRDCMIEASVPYTPDLTVYGNNLGMTDLKNKLKKFPEEATFNLHDMSRKYMDAYKKWVLTLKAKKVRKDSGITEWKTEIPEAIKKYVEGKDFPEGTVVTLYEDNGEEYVHIEYGSGSGSVNVKLASLNNPSIEFTDLVTKVGAEINNSVPRNKTEEGNGVGNNTTPPPGVEYITLWALQWEGIEVDKVHDIDHIYEPPKEHYINLYNKEFDLRHSWSFGVYQRNFNEVQLEKDLYKATMVVNGKKEVYSYSGKLPNEDGDQYNFEVDELINLNKPVNGGQAYTREVRKSDYLYDENVAYGDGKYSKNIKAYLTYKIKVHNASPYTIRINEIADYYDADNLEFDGVRDASGRYEIATHTQNIDGQITQSKYTYASNLRDTAGHDVNKEYIGIYDNSAYTNGDNTKIKEEFKIANDGQDNNGKQYNLMTLYIRGNGAEGIPVVSKKGDVETVTNQLLPSQSTILFVTFKVKNNAMDNGIFTKQIKLDQITKDFADKLPTIGKNNFAEINSYASYYTAEMPSDAAVEEKQYYRPYGTGRIRYGNNEATYLDINGNEVGKETNKDICIAGVVDVYSNPGSFTERDVEVVRTDDGEYKELRFKDNSYRKITRPEGMPKLNKDDAAEESLPTVEPDMDKAPSIRIILDDDQIRKISGYVFEDEKTVNSDGSPIGNGKMDDGETRINGVTVQLVELIQDVDYDGTFTGQYIGEKVWDECEYTGLSDVKYQLKAGSENQGAQYYSGKGTKYILNSTSNLAKIYSDPSVANETTEDGKYCFAGLPSGDFIVRFIYGDTDRTVLTNGTDNNNSEKAAAVRETAAVNALTGRTGMNVKSYNGQDFKSTVYQRDLASNSQVNQNAISYKMKENNEVKGYVDTLNQDYASMYNYNHNQLRAKEQLYDSNIIYYAGQPINNSGDLTPSQNGKDAKPRTNIANSYGSMWRYDRVATEGNKDLSDVNDLYGYRQRGIDYAQGYTTGVNEKDNRKTLLNYRAEVLSSFERLTSQEYADGSYNKDVQNAMIDELTANTYMVAQAGIISMNNEYEGKNDNDPNILNGAEDPSTSLHRVSKTYENHESNVDLGLVERPRAQVKLTKNVSNMEIKLADGQTLFNANTSMKNLIYDDHSEHDITYKEPNKGPILEKVRVTLQSQSNPELIQAFMDDEIMDGATINITYHLQVENVGEIDYNDRDFYFYGKKSGDVQPVTTKVVRVIDYVPNDVSYDASKQNEDAHWDVYKPSELINSRITETENANNNVEDIVDGQSFADPVASTNNDNINRITARTATGDFYDKVNRDYVTRTYAHEVETYNTVVVTKDMNDELLPTLYVNDNSALEGRNVDNTTLILTTSITASGNSEDLTYNNLAEVIETANEYGRRMQFSISGNQAMANQDINDGGATVEDQEGQENNIYSTTKNHGLSSSKIVQPKEIDADSAQQVQILPPTGSPEYRNKLLTIITTTIATIIVLVGAIIIKKKVYDK